MTDAADRLARVVELCAPIDESEISMLAECLRINEWGEHGVKAIFGALTWFQDDATALLAEVVELREDKRQAEFFRELVIGEGQWDRFTSLRERAEAAEQRVAELERDLRRWQAANAANVAQLDGIQKITAPLFKDVDPMPAISPCATTSVTPYGYVRDVVEQLKAAQRELAAQAYRHDQLSRDETAAREDAEKVARDAAGLLREAWGFTTTEPDLFHQIKDFLAHHGAGTGEGNHA